MSHDEAQRIIFRSLGRAALDRVLEGTPALRWKKDRAALSLRYVGSSTQALRLETLDRLLGLRWEAIDWAESADIRVVEAPSVEASREALGVFVRRPRAFTRRLKREGEEDWDEDEVTEEDVRAQIQGCSTGAEMTDPESLPLRVVQAAVYLHRSLKRAAKRGHTLGVFNVGIEE